MKRLLPLMLVMLLSGCTRTIEIPYTFVSEGVYAYEDSVWDHGTVREKLPDERQALQFVTDDKGILLEKGELVYYEGTIYSLSNYREVLLKSGYVEENCTRTYDVLDTVLTRDADRVRLIYQRSGIIRILFENRQGVAHILLEGIE